MPIAYSMLKAVHTGSAALSLTLFVVRGAWMIAAPERLRQRWVKVMPHVIDTVLLASAVALMLWIGNYPGTHGWLTAKVAGVVAYIVLGSVALKRGPTRAIRITAFVAALAVFGYIVSVALTKSAAGFLAWL